MNDCLNTYLNLGFSRESAEALCKMDNTPKNAPKSKPSKAKDIPHPRSKNDYDLVPIGDVVSYNFHERSDMGRFTGAAAGNSDVVMFPDIDVEFVNFVTAIARTPRSKDRDEWLVYADRLSLPVDRAEKYWDKFIKLQAENTLEAVFGEASGWLGYSVPNINQIRMAHPKGADVPSMSKDGTEKKQGDAIEPDSDSAQIVRPPASFPFHTKTAQSVYKKALELMELYPLENPVQIVKRAINALDVNVLAHLTPEDVKLLEMAVKYAQNGAPARPQKKGNPGGPFNSTSYLGKRGTP